MSGPVDRVDTASEPLAPAPAPVLEVRPSRVADVAGTRVHRALPRRGRRTIGAWCFLVARTREEMEAAYRDWQAHAARFGAVRSDLARIDAPRPQWMPEPQPADPAKGPRA